MEGLVSHLNMEKPNVLKERLWLASLPVPRATVRSPVHTPHIWFRVAVAVTVVVDRKCLSPSPSRRVDARNFIISGMSSALGALLGEFHDLQVAKVRLVILLSFVPCHCLTRSISML